MQEPNFRVVDKGEYLLHTKKLSALTIAIRSALMRQVVQQSYERQRQETK